jgi:hypothetical protein
LTGRLKLKKSICLFLIVFISLFVGCKSKKAKFPEVNSKAAELGIKEGMDVTEAFAIIA